MKTIKQTALAVALCLTAILSHAAHLITGIDVSGSNLFLRDSNFTATASEQVAEVVRGMEDGDKITVSTFGDPRIPANAKTHTVKISRTLPAEKAADQVKDYLMAVPNAIEPQGSTWLYRWVSLSEFYCDEGSVVLIITDAQETAEAIEEPDEKFLDGCSITFIGIGAGGLKTKEVRALARKWRDFITAAGGNFDFRAF